MCAHRFSVPDPAKVELAASIVELRARDLEAVLDIACDFVFGSGAVEAGAEAAAPMVELRPRCFCFPAVWDAGCFFLDGIVSRLTSQVQN